VTLPRIPLPLKPSEFSLTPEGLLWQSTMTLATAILLILSFPNFEFTFLAWVGLAPLLHVIATGVTPRRALWLGWMAGVIFTFCAENWIAHSMVYFGEMLTIVAYAVAFLFAAVLALFPAIFVAAMSQLVRRLGWWAVAFAPVVWVATEWLRQLVTGVTWNALGISQAQHFPIAKLSRFGGVYMISAEIVAVSALIVLMLKIKERHVSRAAAILLVIATMMFVLPESQTDVQPLPGAKVTAVGVQPNLPPNSSNSPETFARDLDNNITLTRDGINRTPDKMADVVIWAEAPLAIFYENDPGVRQKLDSLARETGSYLIVNTMTREGQNYFNSIHAISPRESISSDLLRRYDKIRLVPFGEYVPWRAVLGRFVPVIVGDFTPGQDAVVNSLKLETTRAAIIPGTEIDSSPAIERTTNYVRIGSFICYEAAYPEIVRQFVRNGATMLINLSNDAWFGNTAGARQHLLHAMMRAIETDRDLLRVTNTGISALITADGNVVDQLPSFVAGSQVWQAQTRRDQTFYVQHGDWFAVGCVIAAVLALAITEIGFYRRSRSQSHNQSRNQAR
jgi:apolipoprotein N-acyltransferase